MTKHQHSLFLKSQTTLIFRLTVMVAFFLAAATSFAQVALPKVFSDHMVLQRNTHIPVWGKGKPGTQITVVLANNKTSAFAGKDGKWMIHLPQLKAGGPYRLEIFEGNNTNPVITFDDVLIGDIYLASGQSNMEWQVQQAMNAEEEISNAQFPNIRMFKVEHNKTISPQDDIKGGQWQRCDSTSVKDFSAISYYFARELHKEFDIPIGILQSTWGGTPVEAWTGSEMLLSSNITRSKVQNNDTITPQHFVKDSLDLIRFWEIVYNPQNQSDQIYPNPDFDDSQWTEIQMPQTLKNMDFSSYEGMVWLRKKVNIPKAMKGPNLTINLGHPELNYTLYFNGKEICKTIWNAEPEHIYSIPDSLIEAGSNNLTVRMAFLWGGGGFNPPAKEMYITNGEKKISITGTWKYQKDLEPEIPFINNYHQYPSFLHNAMIAPVVPYGLKGFIWYQGENNVDEAYDYRTLFPILINDWRIRWQQGIYHLCTFSWQIT
ncbi:sialate O-acetylesterase [Marinilabilia salmonicolor]|uniref:sialate O-acetylesterase n=1 Tax=Marinilabilia salmonicolor TaxID=989 RepID=UPI00068656A1|nr:sialate O-acetylesterase [Marinilabilia salmonicolor]